jgi:serine/threonine protein kinase
MAPEILSSIDRQPAVDIFSFGISIYEMCLTIIPYHRTHAVLNPLAPLNASSATTMTDLLNVGHIHNRTMQKAGFAGLLPHDGPKWHALRSGQVENIDVVPISLQKIVASCMSGDARRRPSAADILLIEEVAKAGQSVDMYLAAYDPNEATVPPSARSHSYDEAVLQGNSTTAAGLGGRMGIPPLDVAGAPSNNSAPGTFNDRVMTPLGGISFWHPAGMLISTTPTEASQRSNHQSASVNDYSQASYSPCSFTPR